MTQFWLEAWVILIALLVAVNAATIGSFLVLQRQAMLADAMSHAVLLGLVVAVLFFGERSTSALFLGATIVCLLTAYIAFGVQKRGIIREDAGIGISFTSLFALGVLLSSLFAREVDIDQDCILYGEIIFTPFDTISFFGFDIGPRAFWSLFLTLLAGLFVIGVSFRKLQLITFDPLYAKSLGLRVEAWKFLLLFITAIVTVVSFRAVGAILILAFLIVPPNAALQFGKTLRGTILLSWLFAILSVAGGYFLASWFDASVSASMAVASAVFFSFALLVGRLVGRPA